MTECICLPESAGGTTLSSLLDGQKEWQCGPEAAPASLSLLQERSEHSKTSDTSGQKCSVSSRSAGLQSCLESRLQARFGMVGSMEYKQTWKRKATPAGRPYLEHTASTLHTSGSVCTGWATPRSQDSKHNGNTPGNARMGASLTSQCELAGWPTPNTGPQNDNDSTWERRREELKAKHGNNGFGMTLGQASQLAGWPSPRTPTGGGNHKADPKHMHKLEDAVMLAGWATASARDWKDGRASQETMNRNSRPLNEQVVMLGATSESSTAETESLVESALNPAMSRWLIGYHASWDQSSPWWQEWRSVQEAIALAGCVGTETR